MNKLFLVGTGPGDLQLMVPKATAAIAASTDLVAYGFYLELLGDIKTKTKNLKTKIFN